MSLRGGRVVPDVAIWYPECIEDRLLRALRSGGLSQ
jgi:hypothetical protein